MRRLLFLLTLLTITFPSCQGQIPVRVPTLPTATAAPIVIRLGVVSSAAPLSASLASAAWPGADMVQLQFLTGTSSALFADLAAGLLDGVFAHRLPAEFEGYFTPIAVDGLVALVHPDNPVDNLTFAELRGLFSGQIADWSSVGGPSQPVLVLSRERGSGNRDLFVQRVMVELPITINAQVPTTYEALLDELALAPGAIAYGMMGHSGPAKLLTLEGVAATSDTTAEQSYPLAQPLYFSALAEPAGQPETTDAASAELRAFVAWLQSADGQALLAGRYGRVLPVGETE